MLHVTTGDRRSVDLQYLNAEHCALTDQPTLATVVPSYYSDLLKWPCILQPSLSTRLVMS